MNVTAISDLTETEELHKDTNRITIWNGHKVKELGDISQAGVLRAIKERHESSSWQSSSNQKREPLMTKASVSYSEKEGWTGEVSVSFDLFKSEDKDNSSGNTNNSNSSDNSAGSTAAGDVDSRDREQDSDRK
jgi:hypothetical protein